MRTLLAEIRTLTEGSLVLAVERGVTRYALDSARAQDDFADEVRAILGALRASWFRVGADRAVSIARAFIGRVSARHRERFYASAREAMGVDLAGIVSEEKLGQVLRLKTEENVALIRSIPEEYLDKVERAVYQHVIHGQPGQKSLARKIQEIGEVSESRARFIARDQTAKLVSSLNRERNLAIGIEEYRWRTSKDERVRETHRRKEGKTFRWDDPPADTGHPGEDFNCRCTASPVLKV
jgi:SPP1 gp7 family putative phage head morphogenesis protein